jgi:zinc resistance-associated protein
MKRNTTIAMTLTVLAVFGLATLAVAGWGRGYGHMGGYGYGPMGGPGMMGPGWQQGCGYADLSPEESAALEKQRTAFLEATDGLRQQLYEKNLALQSELAKEDPDTGNASKLQSEISELRNELDQKRLDYEIQARKTAPNLRRGYGGGYGPCGGGYGPMMGYGARGGGYGPMMGYGPRGGGYCGQ